MRKRRADDYFSEVGVLEVLSSAAGLSLDAIVEREVQEAAEFGDELDPVNVRAWLLTELAPYSKLYSSAVNGGRL